MYSHLDLWDRYAETCEFNIYVWVRGDFNGLNISMVKVQVHGEIDLRYLDHSGRDRNLKISILMFGFMGIPASYSFSR
jgi:hypothetical protein